LSFCYGVGLAGGIAAVDLRIIWRIISSWIATVPVAALTSALIYVGLKEIFYERLRSSVLDVVAESPFGPLGEHAKKGVLAVEKLAEAMGAYCAGNQALVEERTNEIDKLEHEADKLKQKVRANIPTSVKLPVNKKNLLSFLKQQDSIADFAQTSAYWMTLRPGKNLPKEVNEGFLELMATSPKVARKYDELADELYKLLATSFSKEEIKENEYYP
jgi:predicted phosphate transport protein (TIGR00153 family)